MYGRIVLGVDGELFETPLEAAKVKLGTTNDADLDVGVLKGLCATYLKAVKKATGEEFPQRPSLQLRGAVEAVFASWDGAPSDRLPRPREDQPRPRYGGQRPGHGFSATATTVRPRASDSRETLRPERTNRTATSSSMRRAKTWWRESATPRLSTR